MDTQSPSTASDEQPTFHSMNAIARSTEDIFEKLHQYQFDSDPEFAKGLSIILGHPNDAATQAEINRDGDDIVLQAKCFYFSRKEKLSTPLDFRLYKDWLRSRATTDSSPLAGGNISDAPIQANTSNSDDTRSSANENTNQASTESTQAQPQDPVYPTSFAHIVDLITTGKPIPGIEQIPDTVLTGHDLSTSKAKRRKPWEKDESGQVPTLT